MDRKHYLSYGNNESWRERLQNSPTDGHDDPENWQGYEIFGAVQSPPSVKMAVYLRWKRLPFTFRSNVNDNLGLVYDEPRFSHISEPIMPLMVFPDGRSMNDSTFLIRAIEDSNPKRPVIPGVDDDPCLRFVCQLLEDFADEWLLKPFYGFRWNESESQEFASQMIANTYFGGGKVAKNAARFVKKKQTNPENRTDAFIEGSYSKDLYRVFHDVCRVMEGHFSGGAKADMFMCGNAPTNIDFAFYGMFYQFMLDITPRAILPDKYPHTFAWAIRMNDTSGVKEAPMQVTQLLKDLLQIASNSYFPFMKATAERFEHDPDNNDMMSITVFQSQTDEGITYSQRPWAYQAKCWQWLQEDLAAALGSQNKTGAGELRTLLEFQGCWSALTDK